MIGLAMLAFVGAGNPTFERQIQCMAYREQWQQDLHNAGQPVPKDDLWFRAVLTLLDAEGTMRGVDHDKIVALSNAAVKRLQSGLTSKQTADWKKCQAELSWQPDPDGAHY